jgi:hypothetical protein
MTTTTTEPNQSSRIVSANVARDIFEALKEQERTSAGPCNQSFAKGAPIDEPKPKPTRGRPRKQPGDPKGRYAMTVKALAARSKAGRAGKGACKLRDSTFAPTTEGAKS